MNSIKRFLVAAWNKPFVKEAALSVLGACAIQLAFGLNDLVGFVKLADNWSALYTSGVGWAGALSFRLVQTGVTQLAVFGMTKLGGKA